MKAETNKYAVPALDKGLDILEFLVTQDQPLSQTDIAKGLGRKPNEIYRVLVGLETRGYLQRDESTGLYRVSFKLYHLSRNISPIDHVRQCALPHMEDLAVTLGQSCYLTMLYQSQTMVIVNASSHSAFSLNVNEGALFPTTVSTAGKVLLANSNPSVQDMILERDQAYASLTKRKKNDLHQQLKTIKLSGHHCAPNPFIESATDFAALIGQPEGKVIAALATSSLKTTDTSRTTEKQLNSQVQNVARKISEELGSE